MVLAKSLQVFSDLLVTPSPLSLCPRGKNTFEHFLRNILKLMLAMRSV